LCLAYRVIDVATGELRTTGKSKHCFLNEEGRPVSLKKVQPHVHASFETYREYVFSV
jgi:acyl-CoA thioester hydrolase